MILEKYWNNLFALIPVVFDMVLRDTSYNKYVIKCKV